MKKQFIAGAVLLASVGAVSAQGLYDIAPNDEAKESSPLKWNAGLTYNIDDNVTPTVPKGVKGFEDEASSITAYVGAALVSITPQTTWVVSGHIGGTFYIDKPVATATDDMYGQARLGVNWTHRVSERLRFSSHNYFAYELEPDYSQGFSTTRQLSEYFHYTSDNSVGYRWTERFATYTGVKVRGINYGSESDNNDRMTYSFYNQFRYRGSEQTVWTFDYRYTDTDASGTAADSTSHYALLGVEHRFSPNTFMVLKAGVQMRDVSGGESDDNPFFEGAIRTQINEQFSVRAFARYSMEEYGTSFSGYTYDTNSTLRVGISADYMVSPQLRLNAGLNLIMTELEDGRGLGLGVPPTGATGTTTDEDLLNLSLGFSYEVNDGVFVTGSYNWTDSDSDITYRDYGRNQASLGVRVEF
jgi:hypothetical protein